MKLKQANILDHYESYLTESYIEGTNNSQSLGQSEHMESMKKYLGTSEF
jgi:hypothetical protein